MYGGILVLWESNESILANQVEDDLREVPMRYHAEDWQ